MEKTESQYGGNEGRVCVCEGRGGGRVGETLEDWFFKKKARSGDNRLSLDLKVC